MRQLTIHHKKKQQKNTYLYSFVSQDCQSTKHTLYTMEASESLESKKSSGHDSISNTSLKIIKAFISQSLKISYNNDQPTANYWYFRRRF